MFLIWKSGMVRMKLLGPRSIFCACHRPWHTVGPQEAHFDGLCVELEYSVVGEEDAKHMRDPPLREWQISTMSWMTGTHTVTKACCKTKLKRRTWTSSHRAHVSLSKCIRGFLEGNDELRGTGQVGGHQHHIKKEIQIAVAIVDRVVILSEF